MTIYNAMDYADGPFFPNVVVPDYPRSNDNLQYPLYFDEHHGGYADSTTIDTVDTAYGTRHHTDYNNSPAPIWSCFDTIPLDDLGGIRTAFPGNTLSPHHVSMRSPVSTPSRASSESVPRTEPSPGIEAHSRAPSPQDSKSPYVNDSHHQHGKGSSSTLPPRKRGRPRLYRTPSVSAEEALQLRSPQRASCVPHKQIERKYREGLNMEFERLRRAVPTLPQCVEANVIGVTKPSKGMVLAAAIDYIERIERERDTALDEIERLGGTFRVSKLNGPQSDRRLF